jgi:hypothetical protein
VLNLLQLEATRLPTTDDADLKHGGDAEKAGLAKMRTSQDLHIDGYVPRNEIIEEWLQEQTEHASRDTCTAGDRRVADEAHTARRRACPSAGAKHRRRGDAGSSEEARAAQVRDGCR